MRFVALTALLCAAAPQALAQEAATPPAAAAPSADAGGVIAYPPEFFAESRPNTALDMVSRLPGFSLEQVDASVRGFAGAAGNALVDGSRPASKTDSLSDVLARIPASQVARIELIRGGAPGIDMGGRSVVVNVVRRRADTFQQVVSLSSQTFLETGKTLPGFRYEATRQAGGRTYEFAGGQGVNLDDSIGRGERVRRDVSGTVTRREQARTDAGGRVLNGKATIKTPLLGGEFRGGLNVQESTFEDEDRFDGAGDRLSVQGESERLSGELSANYDRDLAPRWKIETVALQKLTRGTFVGASSQGAVRDVFTSDSDSGESILRGLLRFRRSDKLSFEGGGEAAFNFREGVVGFTSNGVAVEVPSANVRVEERRGEAFVQTSWRPRPSLSLEAGSRFESSTITQSGDTGMERSFFYPKPRVLLTWSPNKSDQLRLRLEREVGQLDFGDFVSSSNLTDGRLEAGNPELEPSKTWVAEIAAERRFWGAGAVTLTLKHEEITDAIDRVPIFVDSNADGVTDRVFDAPGNIGDGTNDELKLSLTLPFQRLGWTGAELKVDATVRKSEVVDPTTGEPRRISGQRPVIVETELRQDLPRYGLTLSAVYFDGFDETYYRFDEIADFRIRRYAALAAEYKPSPKWNLRAELANIAAFTFVRSRRVFDGPRDTGPLLFSERFATKSQARLALRLRRTWGA